MSVSEIILASQFIQSSWVVNSLMNHTLAVKFRGFKHTSHKMHVKYWTEIFWQNLSFKALLASAAGVSGRWRKEK